MTKAQILLYAKQAGLVSQDATGFDQLKGNLEQFIELVTQEAREEGFTDGQLNMLEAGYTLPD